MNIFIFLKYGSLTKLVSIYNICSYDKRTTPIINDDGLFKYSISIVVKKILMEIWNSSECKNNKTRLFNQMCEKLVIYLNPVSQKSNKFEALNAFSLKSKQNIIKKGICKYYEHHIRKPHDNIYQEQIQEINLFTDALFLFYRSSTEYINDSCFHLKSYSQCYYYHYIRQQFEYSIVNNTIDRKIKDINISWNQGMNFKFESYHIIEEYDDMYKAFINSHKHYYILINTEYFLLGLFNKYFRYKNFSVKNFWDAINEFFCNMFEMLKENYELQSVVTFINLSVNKEMHDYYNQFNNSILKTQDIFTLLNEIDNFYNALCNFIMSEKNDTELYDFSVVEVMQLKQASYRNMVNILTKYKNNSQEVPDTPSFINIQDEKIDMNEKKISVELIDITKLPVKDDPTVHLKKTKNEAESLYQNTKKTFNKKHQLFTEFIEKVPFADSINKLENFDRDFETKEISIITDNQSSKSEVIISQLHIETKTDDEYQYSMCTSKKHELNLETNIYDEKENKLVSENLEIVPIVSSGSIEKRLKPCLDSEIPNTEMVLKLNEEIFLQKDIEKNENHVNIRKKDDVNIQLCAEIEATKNHEENEEIKYVKVISSISDDNLILNKTFDYPKKLSIISLEKQEDIFHILKETEIENCKKITNTKSNDKIHESPISLEELQMKEQRKNQKKMRRKLEQKVNEQQIFIDKQNIEIEYQKTLNIKWKEELKECIKKRQLLVINGIRMELENKKIQIDKKEHKKIDNMMHTQMKQQVDKEQKYQKRILELEVLLEKNMKDNEKSEILWKQKFKDVKSQTEER